ncbi:glutamate 5-kinase 1 [Robertmurraya siralis]|uniref:Glutamate 5-kinase n=1 Tax=Robertmurraya siralis TaxID=77777 RepID=A0A920BSD6_9BACI|nr:glutamate 5-kinase [Robertmurraya siralis]PAE22608.1 glutamate 5-kinase [Bacillus sp. 7504-2]GIN60980.1 glutamate 5-kinase 1 [Robertmurraya siralis]
MNKKRIVVKIGSSSLTNANGEIAEGKLKDHVKAIVSARRAGHEIILVSSGAVAAGFKKLGYPARPVKLKGKQAAAAVGQSLLIQTYAKELAPFGITPAQILLTRNDFSKKDRYRNAYSTISELLARGILPIINENDTVSVEELTFGDNDMLSALVSGMLHADQLIILTDINGLYDRDPRDDYNAKRFDFLEDVSEEMMEAAKGTGSNVGTGGMKSKLLAAKTAISLGVKVFIGLGKGEDKLLRILTGFGDGTYIGTEMLSSVKNNKQWISLHSPIAGKLFIDQGAEKALLSQGSSLLPAGIYGVDGVFDKGNVVEVYGRNGLLGKGEVLYSSDEIRKLMGKGREELKFEKVYITNEVIHRDQWVQIYEGRDEHE